MKKGVLIYFFTYITYIIFLMVCYKSYLIDVYSYYGFNNNMTPLSLGISAFILFIVFAVIYRQKTNSYSKFLVYILTLINFIPSIVTFCFMPFNYKYLILLSIYWFSIMIFINFFNKFHLKDEEKIMNPNSLSIYLIAIIELFVMLLVLNYTGVNLNFGTVYDLRENYFLTKIPTILTYLYASFKVVNPLFFVYFMNNKKKFWCFLTIFIQIIAFLGDGSKSTLFSIFIAYVIVKYANNKQIKNYLQNDNTKYYILFGLMLINVIGFLEYHIIKSSYIYNYFIRRTFFFPPLLNHYYFDFFSIHQFDYFRQSFLGKFGFISPYNQKIQNIIGKVYFSSPSMFANNGLFSDAYMNLGTLGIFIMPILICMLFRFLDYCSKNVNQYYLIMVLISVSYTFISSSLFTVLLTHGYILLCLIILFVIPKNRKEGEDNE